MSLLKEPDFGTPARAGEATIELTIDGVTVQVPPGTSVMRAAKQAGVDVPKLCATDNLEAFGSCRLCVVEIDGVRGTPASVYDAVPGRAWWSGRRTRGSGKLRRGVMELYISDHPLDCLTCSANGDCELQDMAGVTGLREVRYGSGVEAGANHMDLPTDTSNPYFDFEASKCIACSRCVRACDEVQGTLALTIEGRGFDSKVAAGAGVSFFDSDCVSCGACVQACPTATLQEKSVVELGMPTRSVMTTCAYCGVGCSFKAELRGDELVRMVPYKNGGANEGHSCVKGRFAFGYASHPDRVMEPMVRDTITDPWRKVSWEEAIGVHGSPAARDPGRARAGLDRRDHLVADHERRGVRVQKMVRAVFGNNNVDTCARVCHSPTGYGLKQTFGESAGTQDFSSVDEADVILVIGANPTDAHPVFGSRMKQRLRQGAQADRDRPAQDRPGPLAAHRGGVTTSRSRPGTNVAIVNAFAHVVVTEGLVDREFVASRCEDFEAVGDVHRAARAQPGGGGRDHRRTGGEDPRSGPAVRDRRQRRRSTTVSASPSTARARPW